MPEALLISVSQACCQVNLSKPLVQYGTSLAHSLNTPVTRSSVHLALPLSRSMWNW